MFRSEKISFRDSRSMNRLVLDYLEKKEELKPFYNSFPDKKGFQEFFSKDQYSELDRNVLTRSLLTQFQKCKNGTAYTKSNIEKLSGKNCFTVTTGHQLCLFTGPLYFIYKILSAIQLAEELKQLLPEKEFVPVYWMAGEDHDFEEVNHFHVYGKKISWERNSKGPVGRMKTEGLEKVLDEFKQILEGHPNSEYLLSLFKRSYLENKTLSDATRYLVNELFGEYGLIIAEGDDTELKKSARTLFHADIFENRTNKAIEEQITRLNQLGYKQQVNPREINCFYMTEGMRERIVMQGESYSVLNTNLSFSKEELKRQIEENPESFSPNVALRPLYQQSILPNIAYVGGPGELAYWLQYKKAFEEYRVVFPVLVPRASFTLIDEGIQSKIEKLGLPLSSLFKDESEQIKETLKKATAYPDFNSETEEIKKIYAQLGVKIKSIDQSLLGALAAEEQKSIKAIETLHQKVVRALKLKEETSVKQIETIHSKLFPDGVPQERYANFSQFSTEADNALVKELKSFSDPLLLCHQLILTDKRS